MAPLVTALRQLPGYLRRTPHRRSPPREPRANSALLHGLSPFTAEDGRGGIGRLARWGQRGNSAFVDIDAAEQALECAQAAVAIPFRGVTNLPPLTGQWTPTHPTQPGTGSRVLASCGLAIAIALGAAALIVALTRPTTSNPAATPKTSAPVTYTAADIAATHQKLCEV